MSILGYEDSTLTILVITLEVSQKNVKMANNWFMPVVSMTDEIVSGLLACML